MTLNDNVTTQNKNRNLFLISSPLQLLNALEAREYYDLNSENCVLIIFKGSLKTNYQQMQYMIKTSEWKELFVLRGGYGTLSWFRRTEHIKLLCKKLGESRITKVFLGDYRLDLWHDLLNYISYGEFILLDDGDATLDIYKNISESTSIGPSKSEMKSCIKRFAKKIIFNISTRMHKANRTTFFTVFDLNEQCCLKIVKNEYKYLKKKLEKSILSDEVYFLGKPLSELEIVKESKYLEYFKKFIEYYYPLKIVYIPHRRESKKKLRGIGNNGIEVKWLNTCLEYELCISETVPKVITSFYSSAIPNCMEIFGKLIEIHAIKIDQMDISKPMQLEIAEVYTYYEKQYEYDDHFKLVSLT